MFGIALLVVLHLLAVPVATNAATLLKVPFSSKLFPNIGLALNDRADSNAPLRNAVLKVVTPVQAGDSQTFNDVLVDTGSGILWVGGEDTYRPGPNTQTINSTFGVGYGVGSVSGTALRDKITIGEATANSQIIGAANVTSGFSLVKPIDGILGLGPSGSNAGDVSGFDTTPTFVETLVSDGSIDTPLFGIFISPLGVDGVPEGTGEITFGGIDESRIQGDVTWLAQNPPVNFHWEFNVAGFSFGNITLTDAAPARTDTGTLAISLPFDQFFDIRNAYNGTIASSGVLSDFLAFPSNTASALPALTFTLGPTTFTIPPVRYLIPRSLYSSFGLADNGLAWTWITSAGPGEYGFGQKWLESVYTVYDMTNHRVGFAHLA